MSWRHRALGRQTEEDVGAGQRIGQRARLGLDRKARLPLVHAVRAALVDHALGVAQDEILRAEADRPQQLQTGDAGGAGAVADELGGLDVAPGQIERIDQPGRGDDRGAVLVVMEDRDVEQFAQPLLDDEAFRRLDVLEIDAAPALAEELDAIDELVRILGRDLEIDGIDVGEALEQHRLAFHHRLGGERAAIAETEDRGAVGDDGDEIALGRVVVGAARVLGDRQHRAPRRRANRRATDRAASPSAWWPPLRACRAGRPVEQQRFLVGEGRPLPAVGFGHTQLLTPGDVRA